MEVIEAIYTRRSIRKYVDIPVEWEIVGRIVEAGTFAPTAGNLQEFRFVVVTDEAKKKALAEACLQQYWMEQAPVMIVACAELKRPKQFYGLRGERLYTIQNVAAACQNMLLAGHSYGLGGCWVGAFDEVAIKRILNMPEYARPHAVLTFGYPDEVVPMPQKYKIENLTYLQRYHNRIRNIHTVLGEYSPNIAKGVAAAKHAIDKHAVKFVDKIKHKFAEIKEGIKSRHGKYKH